MLFRNNINALRALAVIAVVLFHFKIDGFNGGFTGVDVFFVISGFLMTGIIFSGLRDGNFSLFAFYASRARRIIPALAVMCAALMVFGFVYLSLDDYRELLRTVKSSLFFMSNVTFAKGGSYFDAPLHENWLLHTWSLSVEWQFYLLYPVILMGLFKYFGDRGTRHALVALGACSLIASVAVTSTHPVFSFYMLPTRAWEMIAGGLVFLFPMGLSRGVRAAFEVLGLALVGTGVYLFSEQDFWPGYLAVVPVLGTALVIYANTNSIFSSNRVLQFAGKISYSVYLWHWPIVVFLYTCGLLGSTVHAAWAILMSFALGALSYYAVEARAKKITRTSTAIFKYGGAGLAVVVLAAITASVVKDHPQLRFAFADQGQPAYTSKLYTQECYPNDFGAADCKLGSGKVAVILFGDSHAQSTAAAVQLENKDAALSWARGGCPTLLNFQMQDKDLDSKCQGFNRLKVAALKESYPGVPVVLFSRAALYSDHSRDNGFRVFFNGDKSQDSEAFAKDFTAEYAKTVCAIAEQHPVYIVRPIPEMPFSVYKGLNLQSRILGSSSDITVPLESHQKRTRLANAAIDTAAAQCHAKIIDPAPYLCPNGHCLGSKNGVPLYFDDNHLVDSGNEQLRGLFKSVFDPT
ncbi:acyltransferase family protein [Pseudomonas sp. GXZC]|uniref:acyltransferase family protein n=1 Tax=Pseudomonas sp. GXZC TaxID=3003351 RepID=UPI0022AB119D|nr:acyltransferase family protein [Pseudomonas sp. GXZC]WAT32142.1 acyltransferase family protein [Pseudomonas sp. GXZC]